MVWVDMDDSNSNARFFSMNVNPNSYQLVAGPAQQYAIQNSSEINDLSITNVFYKDSQTVMIHQIRQYQSYQCTQLITSTDVGKTFTSYAAYYQLKTYWSDYAVVTIEMTVEILIVDFDGSSPCNGLKVSSIASIDGGQLTVKAITNNNSATDRYVGILLMNSVSSVYYYL